MLEGTKLRRPMVLSARVRPRIRTIRRADFDDVARTPVESGEEGGLLPQEVPSPTIYLLIIHFARLGAGSRERMPRLLTNPIFTPRS